MKSILVAAAFALAVTLLGTPIAIKAFRVWGWGQRIREDGPHTHMEKMGTPTMGGIVILIGLLGGFLASRFTFRHVTARGPRPAVRRGRLRGRGVPRRLHEGAATTARSGLSKLQKFVGTAIVSVLFAVIVVHYSAETGTSTQLSFIRTTGLNLGVLFYVWAFVILTASSHAVNLTDGLDGLASGSSILVLSAFMFIAFWQFRHACGLGPPEACYAIDPDAALDTAIVAAAMMGAVTGFLWWNAAPARIFMGDTGALALGGLFGALAITLNTQLLLIVLGGLVRDRDDVGDPAGDLVPWVRPADLPHVADPHHFELAGWPEFTVIVRFWIIAGLCVAVGIGLFYVDFISRGGLG